MATYTLANARYGKWDGTTFFLNNVLPGLNAEEVIHFQQIPDGGSYPTGGTILTGCTLQITALPVSQTVVVSVVTANDAAPDATTIPNYKVATLAQGSMVSGHPTIDLSATRTNLDGSTSNYIPDSLQAAWSRRNQSYLDPYTLVLDPHTLTFILTVTGTVHILGVTLTTTEVAADSGIIGQQYIRNWELGIGSGIVYDGKTGQPLAADEAVQDGWSNLLVAAENWDPRDRGATWRRRLWPRSRLPRTVGGSQSR